MFVTAGPASADCDSSNPASGDTVTCSADGGTEMAGVDAAVGSTGVTVIVEADAAVSTTGIALSIQDASTINNYGSITTDGNFGISADDFSIIGINITGNDNTVRNFGTVTTDGDLADGIFAADGGNVITNRGSIIAGGDSSKGINTKGGSNTVTNTGSIVMTGRAAQAMYALGNGNTLENDGAITVAGIDGHGIGTNGNDNTQINRGSITVLSSYESDGVAGMWVVGTGNLQTNSGIIDMGGDGVTGIYAYGSANTVVNSGVISPLEQSASDGLSAFGVRLDSASGDAGNSLTNMPGAHIEAGNAIAVQGGAGAESVINAGIIIGDVTAVDLGAGDDSLTLVGGSVTSGIIDGGAGSDSFSLTGSLPSTLDIGQVRNFENLRKEGPGAWTLTGTGDHDWTLAEGTFRGDSRSLQGDIANDATLVFHQDFQGTHAGVVSGTGELVKDGSGKLTLAGANTYSGDTIIVAGTLQSDIHRLGGDIANNGTLILVQPTDETFTRGMTGNGVLIKAGPGKLNFVDRAQAGELRIENGAVAVNNRFDVPRGLHVRSGGTLQGIGVIGGDVDNAGATAPGNSIGTLEIDGDYSQGGGPRLDMESEPAAADRLVVNGAANLAGTLRVTAAPGDYRAGRRYTILTAGEGVAGTFDDLGFSGAATKLYVDYQPGAVELATIDADFGSATDIPRPLADYLDANIPVGLCASPTCALAALMSAPEVRYEALGPAVYSADTVTALQQSRLVLSLPGSAPRRGRNVWALALGDRLDRDLGGRPGRYRVDTRGAALGVDGALSPSLSVGALAAQLNSSVGFDHSASRTEADSLYAGVYADYARDTAFAEAALLYGTTDFDTRRVARGGAITTDGEHRGEQWAARVGGGYHLALGERTALTPSLALHYTRLSQDGFDESGDTAALHVDAHTTHSLRSLLGVRLPTGLALSPEAALRPSVYLGWAREFRDATRSVSAHLRDLPVARFDAGDAPVRDTALIEVGMRATLNARVETFIGYRAEFGGGYRAQSLTGGLQVKF